MNVHPPDTNCARRDCPNQALWMPVLLVRPAGYTGQPAEGVIGIGLCDKHKKQARVQDFITDEGWAMIQRGFGAAGKARPDRNSTTLGWKAFG